MQTGTFEQAPAANDQLSGTEPPQTPPEIITHVHPSGISVAGVYLDVPNAECGHLIEHALRQDQEIDVADEYCRNIMREALELQRNTPPVGSQQAIGGETPPPPLTMLIAGVPLDVPSEACARLIAQALQQNKEVDMTDAACRDKMQQALEIQSNPQPAGPAQQPMTGTSALEAVPFAKHLPNSQ